MSELFLTVLNMSITASYVILVVLLARLFLKKAPKVVSYALWSAAAFRLLIPFSLESVFSLFPWNTKRSPLIPADIVYQQEPKIQSGIEDLDTFVNRVLPKPSAAASANPLQIAAEIGAFIWILGSLLLLTYVIVSSLLLKNKLKHAYGVGENCYEAPSLKTPFVFGIFKPKIYLPKGLVVKERRYILLHENIHIRRKDHIIKPFAFLIVCIHWFNPFVWIGFFFMCRDMELSCDEKVLKIEGGQIKKPYATTLMSLATGRYIRIGSPLSFSEGNIKGRIKNVLGYKPLKSIGAVAAAVLALALVIGLILNPKGKADSLRWAKSLKTEDIKSIELIVHPSSASDRYKRFEPWEYEKIVQRINRSHGRLVENPQSTAGGEMTLYITTKDGEVHYVANRANTYLIIDGDAYKADYHWLSEWDYKGIRSVPDDFYSRTDPVILYEVFYLEKGKVKTSVSLEDEARIRLAKDILMDYMIKSSFRPNVNVSELEEYYLLVFNYRDGTASEYYLFLQDGNACLQRGKEGTSNYIKNELYNSLAEFVNKQQ
jgi:beta-lactamase regulating signal transducer with metallopeptidase domain